MFRNNVFRNPTGWARMMVGSRRRYLVISTGSAMLGIALIVLFHLPNTGTWIRVGTGVLVFIGCVELPLYYLRAMRALVEKDELRRIHEER